MADTQNSRILLESGTNEIEIMKFTIAENLYGINVAKVREVLSGFWISVQDILLMRSTV